MKRKTRIIIISLLCVLLIAIVFFEVNLFMNGKVTRQSRYNYSDWVNYLLDNGIVNASLEKTSTDKLGNVKIEKYDIDKSNVEDILSKIDEYNISKEYMLETSYVDSYDLRITYKKNKETYDIDIINGKIMATGIVDEELNQLLDADVFELKNEELIDDENSFYTYSLDNFDSEFYSAYTK